MNVVKQSHTNKKNGKQYTYYVVNVGTNNGKRTRLTFKTKQEAQEWIRNYKRQKDKYGANGNALTPSQLAIAIDAIGRLNEAGLQDAKLIEAVETLLAEYRLCVNTVSLGTALDTYLETIDRDSQALHFKTSRITLGRLTSHFGYDISVAQIKAKDIEEFFAKIEEDFAVKTYNNTLSYAKTFFNWCITKGYTRESPIKLKMKSIAYADPEFISVFDLQSILEELETNKSIRDDDRHTLINFISLSFFCGLRSSEIFRLPTDAVHPEDEHPFVRVSTTKGAARGIKGRIVDLEPNAVAWFKKYPYTEQFDEKKMYKIRRRLRSMDTDVFEGLFVKNVARHSYITYHTAKYRDYARTEAYVGTSANMRVRHYQGLATTAEAERYFNLFPSA